MASNAENNLIPLIYEVAKVLRSIDIRPHNSRVCHRWNWLSFFLERDDAEDIFYVGGALLGAG